MGWDDAECEDDETFRDILRFIDKYNITKVIMPILKSAVIFISESYLLVGNVRESHDLKTRTLIGITIQNTHLITL